MHVHVHIVFGLAFESSGLLAAMSQTAVVALLCTPVLAVHNFRPTLLRPRAVHLRTAAPSPACIALDPDLQPVDDRDEASTGLDKLTEIPEVIVVSEEVEGASEAPQFMIVGQPEDSPFVVDFPPLQQPEVGEREPVQDFIEGVVKDFIEESPTMFLEDPDEITPSPLIRDDPPAPEELPLGEEATRLAKIEKAKHPLPSAGELARFCLPTLGIWLAPPFLSLIDTSVVGMHCSVSSLAALAPSTKLCDYLSYMCAPRTPTLTLTLSLTLTLTLSLTLTLTLTLTRSLSLTLTLTRPHCDHLPHRCLAVPG